MNENDLKRYQSLLLKLRNRTRPEINRMIDIVLVDGQPSGEHDHKVSECVDKEVVLENTEESLRSDVSAALDRIAAGTFGICARCGKSIPKQRLDALPYTPFCVGCERMSEQT